MVETTNSDAIYSDSLWLETYTKLSTRINVVQQAELTKIMSNKNEILMTLTSGTYHWSVPQKVYISKPGSTKKRIVYIYSLQDRLVIGIIYKYLSILHRDEISSLCFSYTSGTNTGTAIKHLQHIPSKDKQYGYKMDIHAYFNSISEPSLHAIIDELFPINSGVLNKNIRAFLLDNRARYKDQVIAEYKGMVPGCAIASFIANYVLRNLDKHFEQQGIAYARYSDDIIVFGGNPEELSEHKSYIQSSISSLGLTLNPTKTVEFLPGDDIEFLGLKLSPSGIDISNHSKEKIKKQIKRWCRKGRVSIEKNEHTFEYECKSILHKLNYKNFLCSVAGDAPYGWCIYSFRFITTPRTLIELDTYLIDTLRAMKTGSHNKSNIRKTSLSELKSLGYISTLELYQLYKTDYIYYQEVIDILADSH